MLTPGTTINRYRIIEAVGHGGMATVYLAQQLDLDRRVAVKELSTFRAGDGDALARFLQESRISGSLSHPNIVTVHEFFEHDGVPYIAMEYVPNGSLRPVLGDLRLPQVIRVLEQVLSALQYAGKRGIVHRDLKPENLMISEEGTVKVGDFGIAKALDAAEMGSHKTLTGVTVGTPAYMAPEQAMGKPVTAVTDLYSLGVVAFELVCGRLPFVAAGGDTPLALLMRQVSDEPPDPLSLRPDLDPGLRDWILALLEKDPAARPADADAAWHSLEDIAVRLFGSWWRRGSEVVGVPADGGPGLPTEPPTSGDPRTTVDVAQVERASGGDRAEDAGSEGRGGVGDTLPPKPTVDAPEQPDEPPRRRRRTVALVAVAAAVVAIIAGAVFFLGGGHDTTCDPTNAATVDIASPADGARLAGQAEALVTVQGFTLSQPGGATSPDTGWVRFSLSPEGYDDVQHSSTPDALRRELGGPAASPSVEPKVTYTGLAPGEYTLSADLVACGGAAPAAAAEPVSFVSTLTAAEYADGLDRACVRHPAEPIPGKKGELTEDYRTILKRNRDGLAALVEDVQSLAWPSELKRDHLSLVRAYQTFARETDRLLSIPDLGSDPEAAKRWNAAAAVLGEVQDPIFNRLGAKECLGPPESGTAPDG